MASEREQAASPEDLTRLFVERANAGDADGLAAVSGGGEELAYDLQALGRATLVGEPTRGGAHPSRIVSLAEHVELRLPFARSLNPHARDNWEGGGVHPDVYVPALDACRIAHDTALAALRSESTNAALDA